MMAGAAGASGPENLDLETFAADGVPVGWLVPGMRVEKPDGSRHHGVGIRPTHPARRTRAGVAAGRDELLERALALVEEGS